MVREDLGRVEKCDFCASLVDAGVEPACVTVCPAGARLFGDLDDRDGVVARHFRHHEVQRNATEQVDTKPQVFYAGRKEVVERIFTSYPPDPAGLEPSLPGFILGKVLRPGFLGLLGLVMAGQSVAVARQLVAGESKDEGEVADAMTEPMVVRHDTATILLHWFNALVWLLQAVTGAGLLASSGYRVTPEFFNRPLLASFGSAAALLDFHVTVGLIWLAVLIFFGIFGFRHHLVSYLRHLRIDGTDLAWMRIKLRRMLVGSEDPLPPQGKYNAGQKLCGWVISVSAVTLIGSGLLMYFLPGSGPPVRWAIPIHFAAAAVSIVAAVLHGFMATTVASERPVLFSMLHGRIPERYAREHNRWWWDEISGKRGAG
jgi:formate dehydrogenase gamma subunit